MGITGKRLFMKSSLPFVLGRRWLCDPTGRKPFHFVIVGKPKPGVVRCRIEIVGHRPESCWQSEPRCSMNCTHGAEQNYSHKHLKNHARLVEVR